MLKVTNASWLLLALLNASVIVLTKNGEETISKCLEGVFSQKSEHQFEVIILDSGSTDATLDLVSGYDLRLITSQQTK